MENLIVAVAQMPIETPIAIAGVALVCPLFLDLVSSEFKRSAGWKWMAFGTGTAFLIAVTVFNLSDPSIPAGERGPQIASLQAAQARTVPAGRGFNCERYWRKSFASRTPQRDVLCDIGTARAADRDMSLHFRAYRNRLPESKYRTVTAAQIDWMAERDGKCAATWDDLKNRNRKREIGRCLEDETRLRTEQLKGAIASITDEATTASTSQ